MARPKAFDREVVLSRAMAVFWQKGYEATSIQDLVTAMGIHRGSLYDTFHDKRQLFLAAIAHYAETVVQTAIAPLQAPGASRPAIEQHFRTLVERAVADPQRRGCLMTNTVTELAAHDAAIARLMGQSMAQIEDAFYRALVRSQDKGEISAEKDIRALAHYLLTSLQGLRVMALVNPDPVTLQATAELMLQVLD